MKITRAWAMPSSNTFTIKPIHDAIAERISRLGVNVDPFVRNSPFKNLCVSNDIDSDIEANYNVDALDFMKSLDEDYADMILFDPPYSPRQVSECYKKMGKSVNMQTTQASFWSNLKKEISRVSKTGATVMTFGWNSGGIGIKYGFEIEEILLVAHGGWHNDTIVTIERKLHNAMGDSLPPQEKNNE